MGIRILIQSQFNCLFLLRISIPLSTRFVQGIHLLLSDTVKSVIYKHQPYPFNDLFTVVLCHNNIDGFEDLRHIWFSLPLWHSQRDTHQSPPDESHISILYPTLSAFYDWIIDTIHEPPLPINYNHFRLWLRTLLASLCENVVRDEEDGSLHVN